MVYNTSTGGYLGQKLRNMITVRNQIRKKSKVAIPDGFTAAEKEKMEAAMDYLKSAVVNSENLDKIKEKMIETLDYRVELMMNPKMDIQESFPFLFASIDLVSEYFEEA